MKTLSIGITTFRNRLYDVTKQIKDIRIYDQNIPILLAINTNHNETLPETYRKDILRFCVDNNYIYPLMFPKYTGLAKMWNNLIVHAPTTHIFIMSDDITYDNPLALMSITNEIQKREMFEVNWGYGTFVISKKFAYEMKYFDERLVAYGEEDGDFMERHKKMFGELPPKIQIGGLANRFQNRRDDSYDSNLDCFIGDGGHKPIINRKIIEEKQKEDWSDVQQYPYEMFIEDNRHNLSKFTEISKENLIL